MLYEVRGIDRQTGQRRVDHIHAGSEQQATQIASGEGMDVTSCVPVQGGPPPLALLPEPAMPAARKTSGCTIGCLMILLIIFGLMLIGYLSGSSSTTPPANSRTANDNSGSARERTVREPDERAETAASQPAETADVVWTEIDFHKSTVYATVLVETNAQREADFRSIIQSYRSGKLRGDNAFQVYFIPPDAPKLAPLSEILAGRAGDAWQDHLVASYSFNATSGLDELEVYREAPTLLPIEGATAIQLYAGGNETIDDRTFLVRVDTLEQAALQRVAHHYEEAYPESAYLYIYFVTSERKWRGYPRFWPSEMPREVAMVYEHVRGKSPRFVKGSEFR